MNNELNEKSGNDRLKNKIVDFLEGYEDKSDNRVKANDYLKGIEMLFKINVEVNREKMNSNVEHIIDFNIFDKTDKEINNEQKEVIGESND